MYIVIHVEEHCRHFYLKYLLFQDNTYKRRKNQQLIEHTTFLYIVIKFKEQDKPKKKALVTQNQLKTKPSEGLA